MFFSIKELALKKVRFDEDFAPGAIVFFDSGLKQVRSLHAEGVAELLPESEGEVRIKGRVTTEITAECDRCLGEVQIPIDSAIDLLYRPAGSLESDGEEEIEIDAAEAEIAFYEGKGIELEQVIAEQILLLLPMQLVCQEACKGICPACGENRNKIECLCETSPADSRWKALQELGSSEPPVPTHEKQEISVRGLKRNAES